MQLESKLILNARRSPSHGVIDVGSARERSLIDGCLRFVGPSDVLAILYTEPDSAPDLSTTLIAYRLAYLAYPTRIEAALIGPEGIPATLEHLPRKPEWVLLLGRQSSVPGYEEAARFSPSDLLLRATGNPK